MLNMGDVIILPRLPIRFPYCYGSCDAPHSVDARARKYLTYNVLFRQMANLDGISLPREKKRRFKTPCCVPIEYTGLEVTILTENGTTKKDIWSDLIPAKCGCR
ncbi:hypothetical protein OS493_015826 [Desmophyllum pertusum]|uniref:TGF-beta family profile domain-containing protein n=1 Tax=Desmophyllum pertusum TaxID=174260 RepID=A0A9W9YCS2_9CNID|nr:hypothetical protein OS493_015826 [Desmophyllum pertusum]